MRSLKLNLFLIPFIAGFIFFSIYCGETNSQRQTTTQTNSRDTCEGPDANVNCCFLEMPEQLSPVINIADKNEPGERLIIKGTVYKGDASTKYPDVLIYAYHTDNSGYYSKKGNEKGIRTFHGHLYGWGKTDEEGRYEIHSIRPAPYPQGEAPAHIHSVIKEPGNKEPYYINDFVFKDDKYVDDRYLSRLDANSGNGVVDAKKDEYGVWNGVRDIILD